jgi:hypothetical protein
LRAQNGKLIGSPPNPVNLYVCALRNKTGAELAMNGKGGCGCLICNLEKTLLEELTNPGDIAAYQNLTATSLLLSHFPTTSDLLQHLRRSESVDGNRGADEVLAELLRSGLGPHRDFTHRLLLVALTPALHKTSRIIASRFSLLAHDDVEQHIIASTLEILHSNALRRRRSHFAFAIAQSLRRSAFQWAIREAGVLSFEDIDVMESSLPRIREAGVGVSVQLRTFLRRCLQEGLLSESECELLVSFKLDEVPAEKLAARAGQSEGAFRHRMLRVVERLRQAVRPETRKKPRGVVQQRVHGRFTA